MKIEEPNVSAKRSETIERYVFSSVFLFLVLVACGRWTPGLHVIEGEGGRFKGIEIGMAKLEVIRAIKETIIVRHEPDSFDWPSHLRFKEVLETGHIAETYLYSITEDIPEEEWDTEYAALLKSDWWCWGSPDDTITYVRVFFERDSLVRIEYVRRYVEMP